MIGVTPEEKLLNVIKKAQSKMRLKKELKVFTKVNIALIVLIAVILAVFLVDIFTFDYKVSELKMDLREKDMEFLPVEKSLYKDENMDDFIREDVSSPKQDIGSNLYILGIVEGDDDQAVIKDKNLDRTFFLYKGDSFEGFTVYDIKEGSVILEHEGEKIELKI